MNPPCTAQPLRSPRSRHGLSLVEVAITLAVIGVLGAAAMPTFLEQLARSRRVDATAALQRLQWGQERFRRVHGRYAERLDQLVGSTSARSAAGHYRIELRSGGPDSYEAVALAEPSQALDRECPVLSLQVNGALSQFRPNGRCWNL